MRDAVQRSLINIHDGAVHVSRRHGSKTRPSLTYFQCRLRFLHSRRYCFLPSISRPLLCWSRCGTIPNFDKNQRSKSQFFIQTLLEEILKKSYHKSGCIIGSTDPYITLKKNQKIDLRSKIRSETHTNFHNRGRCFICVSSQLQAEVYLSAAI